MNNRRFQEFSRHFLFAIIFLVAPTTAGPLSLKEYVTIVLKNNPQGKIASATVAASQAAYESARSFLLPNVNGSAGISRSESPGLSAQQGGPDKNSASAKITGQALLYDFGQTLRQLQASDKSFNAAKYDSQSVMASTILAARLAYYNYLLSAQVLLVNTDALQQMNLHYDQAKILYEVGKQARITVTKAKVDVANAEVNVIHAKNAVRLAKVQMDLVAGLQMSEPMELVDSLSAFEDSIGLIEAQNLAMKQQPEISSSKATLEAARLSLIAARAAFLPSLNANASLGWGAQSAYAIKGSDFNNSPDCSIGADLSIPIYSGGFINASVKKAGAAVGKSEAQLEATTQSVSQQVQQYFFQEKDALQRIDATNVLIGEADESLKMSQERFRAGVATSLEITDAEITVANARISNAQARYDYHTAHANLLLAIGILHE
jgi:TolC family type I secretion outer membrane protein